MKVPNPHIFPPDGFFFVDTTGVKHVADTWAALEKRIVAYRGQNRLPPGDPKMEIMEFTCARYPAGCREIAVTAQELEQAQAPKPPALASATKLHARVNRWFYRIMQALGENPQKLVAKEEAQSRASICAKCVRQRSWVGECGTCAGSTYRLGVQIRSGQDVKDADQLMGCETLGEDTRTSVWLPNLRPVENDLLPVGCWRKEK